MRGVSLRCGAARLYAGKTSSRRSIRAHRLEAEPLEDRPGHLARVRDEHGRAAVCRLACPRGDERPVGAAAAGGRQRRAAEEEQAERRVRGVARRDRLAVDEREERRADLALGGEVGLGLLEADLVGVAAERLVLDPPRRDELVDRLHAPRGGSRRLGHLVARGEHHPDRDRLVLVGEDAELCQPLDEVGGRARLAELPLAAAATAVAEQRADLLDRGRDLVGREPHALHGGAVRPGAACRGRRRTALPGRARARVPGVRLVDVRDSRRAPGSRCPDLRAAARASPRGARAAP